MRRGFPPGWLLFLLFMFAAGTSAYDYSILVDHSSRIELHRAILTGTAEEPNAYRILVPAVLDPMIKVAARLMPYEDAFARVYALYYLLALTLTFLTMFRYLGLWFSEDHSLVGALLIAATINIALRYHFFQPWSFLEPILMTVGLQWIVRRRQVAFAWLVAVATLNRETAVMLVMLYMVTSVRDRRSLAWALVYLSIWLGLLAGLRLAFDAVPASLTVRHIWQTNTRPEQLELTAKHLALFFGPLWIFAALGYRRAPLFLRRSALVFIPYGALVLLYGLWWEVRLLMPMYPVLMPLALAYIFPIEGDARRSIGGAVARHGI
jgi:hypothetical protein